MGSSILKERKKELDSMAGILSNHQDIVRNPSYLKSATRQIRFDNSRIKCLLEKSDGLIFNNIDLDNHCYPSGIEKLNQDKRDVGLELTIKLEENLDVECGIEDPVQELGVNIIIDGVVEINEDHHKVLCSWHLDKDKPAEDGEAHSFCHPKYHFTFGGSNMTKPGPDENVDFGNLLILSSPRLCHPPMDIILAIDFVLKNFYKKERHRKITRKDDYQYLVRKAKERYWKPYAFMMASHWQNDLHENHKNSNKLFYQ